MLELMCDARLEIMFNNEIRNQFWVCTISSDFAPTRQVQWCAMNWIAAEAILIVPCRLYHWYNHCVLLSRSLPFTLFFYYIRTFPKHVLYIATDYYILPIASVILLIFRLRYSILITSDVKKTTTSKSSQLLWVVEETSSRTAKTKYG